MKIYDESKRVECDVCLKVFPDQSSLNNHNRTHTGEKYFACQICGRKFALIWNLDDHIATHSKIKSIKCTFCGEFLKQRLA